MIEGWSKVKPLDSARMGCFALPALPGAEPQLVYFHHGDASPEVVARAIGSVWKAGFRAARRATAPPSPSDRPPRAALTPHPPPGSSTSPRRCPATPPNSPVRALVPRRPINSPKRGVGPRQLLRHKRNYNSAPSGRFYCLAIGTGTRMKALHRFACNKYVYQLRVTHRRTNETRNITGVVDPERGQVNEEYYTTTSPCLILNNGESLAQWFKLKQTRGVISDGLQTVHLTGNFTGPDSRATELQEWIVNSIVATKID